MKRIVALMAALLLAPTALADPTAELTAPIHQFIDGFNNGNVESAYAAYAEGEISITDEFAPHIWVGPNAASAWADSYVKRPAATGVADGSVKYGAPTRIEDEGDQAYVIIPTVYAYREKGKAIAEEAEMTFVLNRGAASWKIRAWTWAGAKPHPAK